MIPKVLFMLKKFNLLLILFFLCFYFHFDNYLFAQNAKSVKKIKNAKSELQDEKLPLRERIEKHKKTLKEKTTTLKSEKYEIDLTEVKNEKAIWDSWPVVAKIYNGIYGYIYSVTLEGTSLDEAFIHSDYLYAYLHTLGSSYPSDAFEAVNLHGWGESKIIKDVGNSEFSPDKRWFAYDIYLGKGTYLSDELGIAWLGGQGAGMVDYNLTGRDHNYWENSDHFDDQGKPKPINWPSGIDRSRTWVKLSDYLWDNSSRFFYFIAGEKRFVNKKGDLQFSGVFLVRVDVPDLDPKKYYEKDNFLFVFNTKPIKFDGDYANLNWKDKKTIQIKTSKKSMNIYLEGFDSTWAVPTPLTTE
jgi:hypothetical protein